jgi:UDP-glucuronate decarboxylase
MNSNFTQPINLGNPSEFTIGDFAKLIKERIHTTSKIVNLAATEDDPQQRKPDITRAGKELGWKPRVPLEQGLDETIEYFKKVIDNDLSQ